MISSEALAEFKQIILEDYGDEITDEQALADATAFLEAIRLLAKNTSLLPKSSVDGQEEGYA